MNRNSESSSFTAIDYNNCEIFVTPMLYHEGLLKLFRIAAKIKICQKFSIRKTSFKLLAVVINNMYVPKPKFQIKYEVLFCIFATYLVLKNHFERFF